MLDDDHRAAGALLDLVNENNGLLAGGGVQVGQGFVEEQDIHLIDHHTAETDSLLLSAGDFVGCMGKHLLHIHQFRNFLHMAMHFGGGDAVIFQGEGNVLRHRQSDELAVGILQHGAHHFGQAEKVQLQGVFAADCQLARGFAGVGIGDQAVDAVSKGGLAAAGGARDQNLLTLGNIQIDVIQRGLCLGCILKTEVFKRDDVFLFQRKKPPYKQRQAKRLPLLLLRIIPWSGSRPWSWWLRKQRTAGSRR